MELYSVLLVDDEDEVISVIMKKIDWEALGFQVIGSATNGVKALEMAEKLQPDVVMTDIRMPYMDGMELARNLRKELPSTRILLFTGFDEFEYAKEAVHLEIDEYILKPINAGELTRVFTKLKESLDQELEEKRSVEKLQNYYLESLPLLQANFYTSLIEGRIRRKDLAVYMTDYQIPLTGPYLCCVNFHTSTHNLPEGMSPLLMAMSVQKQATEHLAAKWRGAFFSYLGNTVMIAQMLDPRSIPELTDDCDRFTKWARRMLNAEVTAGIGKVQDDILRLEQSYAGAREAVSYRVLYGSVRAINISEIAPREETWQETDDDSELRALFKSIHIGQADSIENAAAAYTDSLSHKAKSVLQYRLAVSDLITQLYRFAAGHNVQAESLLGSSAQLYERIPQMEIGALKTWLTETACQLSENIMSVRSNTSKSYVTRAKKYVEENYDAEDLSLDQMCGNLGVSASYFSSIFKKETGESFVGYLTNYRMQQAVRLILETGDKNYEIARKVGYSDANYFSYVFKKSYGMSPSKYRSEHTRNQ